MEDEDGREAVGRKRKRMKDRKKEGGGRERDRWERKERVKRKRERANEEKRKGRGRESGEKRDRQKDHSNNTRISTVSRNIKYA